MSVTATVICMCKVNIICAGMCVPMNLLATHPADHSNPWASCLHTSHFAQSVLRLGDVKLPCQLCHTARCCKRDRHRATLEGTKGERILMESLTTKLLLFFQQENIGDISGCALPPESASLSMLVSPSYANIALWTYRHTSRSAAEKCK